MLSAEDVTYILARAPADTRYQPVLREAKRTGDFEPLRALLEDVHYDARYMYEALCYTTSEANHPEAVEFLLGCGASPNDSTGSGRGPPLGEAANRGCASNVALLLAAGADVNAVDCVGETALSDAVRSSQHSDTVRSVGVGGEQRILRSRSEFRDGCVSCIKLLIRAGALVNDAPLYLAAAADQGSRDIVKIMLCAGAEVPKEDITDRTMWTLAALDAIDSVRSAGGWEKHAKQHERVLAALVSKCAPIPDDAARLVVEFWTPPGGS